mmetsp:Transcript_11014/g.22545  ORF Transcript_11014/g.22545 Transcript_11014/m.22545 type:complete len:238 (+) Transcript_11014:487-1200(+)
MKRFNEHRTLRLMNSPCRRRKRNLVKHCLDVKRTVKMSQQSHPGLPLLVARTIMIIVTHSSPDLVGEHLPPVEVRLVEVRQEEEAQEGHLPPAAEHLLEIPPVKRHLLGELQPAGLPLVVEEEVLDELVASLARPVPPLWRPRGQKNIAISIPSNGSYQNSSLEVPRRSNRWVNKKKCPDRASKKQSICSMPIHTSTWPCFSNPACWTGPPNNTSIHWCIGREPLVSRQSVSNPRAG